jgi:hypothetical protein
MHDEAVAALARHATVRRNGAARPPGRAVIVDIDGVLADTSARQHLLERPGGGRNWDAFFAAAGDDLPYSEVPALVRDLPTDTAAVLVSGRPDWLVDLTADWLTRHGMRWDLLVVRRRGDRTGAARFKRAVLSGMRDAGFVVAMGIDDDERVTTMYVAEGIPTVVAVEAGSVVEPRQIPPHD